MRDKRCYRLLPRCEDGASRAVVDVDVCLHSYSPPNRSADNTGPEHGPEPMQDDSHDPPLRIELTEGSDIHRILVVSPYAGRGLTVTLLRDVFRCEGICIGHEDG